MTAWERMQRKRAEAARAWLYSPENRAAEERERTFRIATDRNAGHVVPDTFGGYGCGLLRCVPECRYGKDGSK